MNQTLVRVIIALALPLILTAAMVGCNRRNADGAPSRLGRQLIRDGGFEQGTDGTLPQGWTVGNGAGSSVAVTSSHALRGARSLHVELRSEHIPPQQPVVVSYAFPIARLSDRDLVLSAVSNGSAEAVAVVDTPTDGRIPPTIERLTDHFEIAHYVPAGASSGRVSFRVYGTKGSWLDLDEVSLRVVRRKK